MAWHDMPRVLILIRTSYFAINRDEGKIGFKQKYVVWYKNIDTLAIAIVTSIVLTTGLKLI